MKQKYIIIVIICMIVITLSSLYWSIKQEPFHSLLHNNRRKERRKESGRERERERPRLSDYIKNTKIVTIKSRLDNAQELVHALGIEPNSIFQAIEKEDVDTEHLLATNVISKHLQKPLQPGEIACYLSHTMLYKMMLEEGIQSMLILEDDVFFDREAPYIWRQTIIKSISEAFDTIKQESIDYDILYFGRCWDLCEKNQPLAKGLVSTYFPGCTHAYYITLRGAEKLAQALFPIQTSLDRAIKTLAYHNKLKCIATESNLFIQNRIIKSELGHESETLRLCLDNHNSDSVSIMR